MSSEEPLYFDAGLLKPDDLSRAMSDFNARGFGKYNLNQGNVSAAQEYSLYFLRFIQSVLPNLVGKDAVTHIKPKYSPKTHPDAAAREVWDKQAKFWAAVESPLNYQLTMETLLYYLRSSEEPQRETYLSLGSGPGLYETFLGNFLTAVKDPKRSRVIGLDYSPEMTKVHRKLLQIARNGEGQPIKNVQAITGDMTHLEFPNKSIDQIICNNSLQWTDWKKAISEMARVINPDSLAYLYLFTHTNPMVMQASDGSRIERGHLPVDELMDTLEASQFQLTNVRQITSAPGLGQRGGQTNRYFIRAQFRADGDISTWRSADIQGLFTVRSA